MEDQGPVKVAGLPHLTGLHLSAEGATHHFGRVSKAQAGQTRAVQFSAFVSC